MQSVAGCSSVQVSRSDSRRKLASAIISRGCVTRNNMLFMGHHVAVVYVLWLLASDAGCSMAPYRASLRNHVITAAAIVLTWQALVDDVVQGQDSHLHLDGLQDRRGAGLACWSPWERMHVAAAEPAHLYLAVPVVVHLVKDLPRQQCGAVSSPCWCSIYGRCSTG